MKILQDYIEKSQCEQWIYFLCMSFISKENTPRIPKLLYPAQILCKNILVFIKLKTLGIINNLEEDDNCFFYRNLPIILANNGHMWAELMIFKYLSQSKLGFQELAFWKIHIFKCFRFGLCFAVSFLNCDLCVWKQFLLSGKVR